MIQCVLSRRREGERVDDALRGYREECAAFFAQAFAQTPRTLVFGEGPTDARLMMIGEAPGEYETLAGRPFVGKAGKHLDAFLALAGLTREALYITNTVKVRPTKVSAKGRLSNRPPSRVEIALFAPWLAQEIALVHPAAIATLGNIALCALAGRSLRIGDVHGDWMTLPGLPAPLFPLYHPASLLYNPGLTEVYARDVRALGRALGTLADS